jgi:hypothetical protein
VTAQGALRRRARPPPSPAAAAGDGPVSITLSDVNKDGKLDALVVDLDGDSISVLLGDGLGGFTIDASIEVGDAPQVIAVGDLDNAQVTAEDMALRFSSENHNAITLSDVDAGGSDETVTLAVLYGALTLATRAGLSVNGDGTGLVTLTGTVAAINAALDGLSYQPAANYAGHDVLTVSANDNGNAGTGGAQTATALVPIISPPTHFLHIGQSEGRSSFADGVWA